MWFCIPAFGQYESHDRGAFGNWFRRGHEVRYYSFEMFREKIIDTGAEYIACDEYLMKPDRKLEEALKRSSTTAMSLNAIETTIRMNDRLTKDVTEYQPDLIVSDSVCFSGETTGGEIPDSAGLLYNNVCFQSIFQPVYEIQFPRNL